MLDKAQTSAEKPGINDDIGEETRLNCIARRSCSGRPSSAPSTCSCKIW